MKKLRLFPFVLFSTTLLFIVLSLESCAVRRSPTGGPADKSAPVLVRSLPVADSVNVGNLEYIELEFDEPIKTSTVRGEIWILPELGKTVEVEWKGDRTIRIPVPDSLLPDQTYIITIGTGVQDLRSNSLKEPITLPFSTGTEIDRGAVFGQVFDEVADGAFIYAYIKNDTLPDSVIYKRKPRYYTQIASDGRFTISYLKSGLYRLFALNDQNNDRLYTPQTDRLGLPANDILIDSSRMEVGPVNFRLLREDIEPPGFSRIKRITDRQLQIFFDENIDTSNSPLITIKDSVSGQSLPVFSAAVAADDRRIVNVFTGKQEDVVYFASIRNVADQNGNRLDSLLVARFSGASRQDTTKFGLQKVLPPATARRVSLTSRLDYFWSLPVDTNSLRQAFSLRLPDSSLAEGRWRWISGLHSRYQISDSLQAGGVYRWELDLPRVKGLYGEVREDSLRRGFFEVISEDDLGEISGVVRMPGDSMANFLLEVAPMAKKSIRTLSVSSGVRYLIPQLPENSYQLRIIHDRNNNRRHDFGRPWPFQFAEPFLMYPDTINVRKRWTTEGINVNFGQ